MALYSFFKATASASPITCPAPSTAQSPLHLRRFWRTMSCFHLIRSTPPRPTPTVAYLPIRPLIRRIMARFRPYLSFPTSNASCSLPCSVYRRSPPPHPHIRGRFSCPPPTSAPPLCLEAGRRNRKQMLLLYIYPLRYLRSTFNLIDYADLWWAWRSDVEFEEIPWNSFVFYYIYTQF